MNIQKVRGLEAEFSIMPNSTINAPLSWAAKGLLAYLLAKPENWKVSVSQLIKHSAESARPTKRDGTYAIINELISAGYIYRQRSKGNGGYSETEYFVSSKPFTDNPEVVSKPLTDNPDTDNPDTDNPDTDNPTLQSKELNKEHKSTNNKSVTKPKRVVKPAEFKEMFELYPAHRKGGTDATAWKIWKSEKLTAEDAAKAVEWLKVALTVPGWQHNDYVLGIPRFIRERIWNTPHPRGRYENNTSGNQQGLTPAEQVRAHNEAARSARAADLNRGMAAQGGVGVGANGRELWDTVDEQDGGGGDLIPLEEGDWSRQS